MKFYKTLALVSLSCLSLGCTPNIKDTANISENTNIQSNSNNVISISISHTASIKNSSDLTSSIKELNESITNDIHSQLPSALVTTNQSKSGLSIEIRVEKFRYVSGFGRFLAGIMVGDAVLKLNVKIKDIEAGTVIGDYTLDTSSESSNGVFGATTSRQIEAMANKIAQYIKNASKS